MYRKEINEADVRYVIEHLRDADRHETIIQLGENYVDKCVELIMKANAEILLGCKKSDDTPVCVGGLADTEQKDIGVVWLLSTPEIVNHQICLLRHIKQVMQKADKRYWMTFNILYKENELAKKWLVKFGYNFDNPHPAGMNIPKDFEFFYRTKKMRGLSA